MEFTLQKHGGKKSTRGNLSLPILTSGITQTVHLLRENRDMVTFSEISVPHKLFKEATGAGITLSMYLYAVWEPAPVRKNSWFHWKLVSILAKLLPKGSTTSAGIVLHTNVASLQSTSESDSPPKDASTYSQVSIIDYSLPIRS